MSQNILLHLAQTEKKSCNLRFMMENMEEDCLREQIDLMSFADINRFGMSVTRKALLSQNCILKFALICLKIFELLID